MCVFKKETEIKTMNKMCKHFMILFDMHLEDNIIAENLKQINI